MPATVSPATQRRLELAAGRLATACLAAMEQRQPWFAQLGADQRAGVRAVVQTGVADLVSSLAEPGSAVRFTVDAFRTAPRDLARRLSLRQTVELVRVAIDVFEDWLPPLATDEDERRRLVEAVLRFGREVAFAAATAYAAAAEARGAWDARLEALVVDAVVRGPSADDRADDLGLVSRAAALGWDPATPLRVVVGTPAAEQPDRLLAELRRHGSRSGRPVLVGVQGSRLVVLVAEPPRGAQIGRLIDGFGPGPVVVGPLAPDLPSAHGSAREALAGLRAAPGWPGAPRPVHADDLLPERALVGDPAAHRRLVATVVEPLAAAGGELLRTLETYLEGGGALESCARTLFVHPNTVRYRLRRVAELTSRAPTDPRDALVLRAAVVAGRLVGG
ncbi:MAG: PucR family transcriptional regulator [Pseudonocardia sp.]